MPQNGMVVGRDLDFSVFDGRVNQVIDFGDVQNVDIKSNKHMIKSSPYNDNPRFSYIEDGYTISFQIVKTTASLEDFALDQAAAFEAGQNCPAGILNETVRYSNGTVRSYQYIGFVWHLDDVGNVSREKNVTQKVEGMASTKKRVA